ncbi:hypothetical protein GQX74_009431 [Glossina fuscipes]|nr:hypothetical protein GQX74_009431 [Glossina fuscipes]
MNFNDTVRSTVIVFHTSDNENSEVVEYASFRDNIDHVNYTFFSVNLMSGIVSDKLINNDDFLMLSHSFRAWPAKYDEMKEMILDPKDGQQTVRIIAIRVEPIEEGDKVKADICKILTVEHIKEYIKAESNYVKESFDENVEEKFIGPCHLSPNRNRPNILAAFEDESTSSEDDS